MRGWPHSRVVFYFKTKKTNFGFSFSLTTTVKKGTTAAHNQQSLHDFFLASTLSPRSSIKKAP